MSLGLGLLLLLLLCDNWKRREQKKDTENENQEGAEFQYAASTAAHFCSFPLLPLLVISTPTSWKSQPQQTADYFLMIGKQMRRMMMISSN